MFGDVSIERINKVWEKRQFMLAGRKRVYIFDLLDILTISQ